MYRKSKLSWIKHIDFELLDMLILTIVYWVVCYFRIRGTYLTRDWKLMFVRQWIVLMLIHILVSFIITNYKNIIRRDRYAEFAAVLKQVVISFALFALYQYLMQDDKDYSRLMFIENAIGEIVLFYTGHIILKRVVRLRILKKEKQAALLVIATKEQAELFINEVKHSFYYPFKVVGAVVSDVDMTGEKIMGVPVVCDFTDCKQYILGHVIDEVYISVHRGSEQDDMIEYLLMAGITVHINTVPTSVFLPNATSTKLCSHMVITATNKMVSGWQLLIKRFFDILISIAGLICTGVIYLFVAPKIRKADPGPVFFKQERVGKNGRTFYMYKFRSMYLDAEERKTELENQNEVNGLMFKMENDPRILPGIGEHIRKTSLDEFPQFINVFKGDMSFVGIRPPTLDEYSKYDAHHKVRLSFTPGITGLWQVSGRSDITDFEEVVRLDNEYIKNWSLWLDLKIIVKTIFVVLTRTGSK